MKILDIITPDETLTEANIANKLTRAWEKWILEPLGLGKFVPSEAESKVSKWIREQLNSKLNPGFEIEPSEELIQAEIRLISIIERNPYSGTDAELLENIANAYAKYISEHGVAALQGNTTIDKIKYILIHDAKDQYLPKGFTSVKQFLADPFVVRQTQGVVNSAGQVVEQQASKYIGELAEARANVINEVKNIQPTKTKEQIKKEKDDQDLADKQAKKEKKVADNELDAKNANAEATIANAEATIAKAGVEIEKSKKIGSAFGRWIESLSKLDKTFLSVEAIRIIAMNWQRLADINRWEASGDIPQEVAQYFPEVKSPGTLTLGGPSKSTQYATNEQRVHSAAFYSKILIARQCLLQLGALGGGLLAANGLLKLGGGTMNYASQMKYAVYALTYVLVPLAKGIVFVANKIPGGSSVVASGSWIRKISIAGLQGISQAGKIMMVDYLAAAVNPDQPYISQPLTDLSNKLSTIPAYKNIQIDHPPDINDAVLGLFTVSLYSIEGFATSPTVKTIIGTYDASLVPAKIFLDTLGAIWNYFNIPTPEISLDMPPAGGKLPGVEPPEKLAKKEKKVADNELDARDAANTQEKDQINGGEKPATDVNDGKDTSKAGKNDITIMKNGVRVKNYDESINEHLKKRVAQLMRS